ncbi:MAG: hypothetical protein RI900_3280 [Actinomycetota bacterium]|jgi:acetolactate synthase-1/2/3 large subunit
MRRTGAHALVETLIAGGVSHVFANPGTSELAFVPALNAVAGIEAVLVVDETVASGAADGLARMTGRPSATLLHLGPGLSNAGANLHNAGKARSPVVNLVGDHASRHRHLPSPLQSDIAAIARPLSCWTGDVTDAENVPAMATAAVEAAAHHRAPATIVITSDAAEGVCTTPAGQPRVSTQPLTDMRAVAAAAHELRQGHVALLLGDDTLRAEPLRKAASIAATMGAHLWAPMFNARVQHPGSLPVTLHKLPYFPGQAHEALTRYRTVVRIGAQRPLAVFAYPEEPNLLGPDGCIELAGAADLDALFDELGCEHLPAAAAGPPPEPSGRLDPFTIGACIGATAPDGLVVVDEGQTSSLGLWGALAGRPHDLLALTGGAIGSGPPLAVGAAIGAPGRRVVNLEGDGSSLYSLGAWWTQASLGLDVTTVVVDNGAYAILDLELARGGNRRLSGGALTSLRSAPLDFVQLAQGYGVPAVRVQDCEGLCTELRRANATPGPTVIHAVAR